MALLEINGTPIKTPATLEVGVADLDNENAGRNQLGTMMRDRVAVKAKVSCHWGPLTESEMSILLGTVSATSFALTYPDPRTGTNGTGTFYVGDRSAPVYQYANGACLWEGLNMNFVEV